MLCPSCNEELMNCGCETVIEGSQDFIECEDGKFYEHISDLFLLGPIGHEILEIHKSVEKAKSEDDISS